MLPATDQQQARAHLGTLAASLRGHGYRTEVSGGGLHIYGGGDELHEMRLDRVTCRPRPEDGGRLWFWSDAGVPLAQADQPFVAVVQIKGSLREGA